MTMAGVPVAARAAYEWDAPGIMLGMLAAGAAVVLAAVVLGWLWPGRAGAILTVMVAVCGLAPLVLGSMMVAYGLAGKLRMRDRMLDAVPWSGGEQMLDVGTGAGLLLVGAAKRLRGGRAVGIDVWAAKDLSDNSQASTERNIGIEDVADRVKLHTVDARRLPMPDGSFDRVMSLLCLHNIKGTAEQRMACREIARVLRPGGTALVGDYVPTTGYAAAFREAGLRVVSTRPCFGTALSPMWLVVAEKPVGP